MWTIACSKGMLEAKQWIRSRSPFACRQMPKARLHPVHVDQQHTASLAAKLLSQQDGKLASVFPVRTRYDRQALERILLCLAAYRQRDQPKLFFCIISRKIVQCRTFLGIETLKRVEHALQVRDLRQYRQYSGFPNIPGADFAWAVSG